jgi:hypothetical protein
MIVSMSSDGPTPPLCKSEIFRDGQGICILDGRSNAVETWVKKLAVKANAQVDWHYSGGRANVLYLGDEDTKQRILNAIEKLKVELGSVEILSIGSPALYRNNLIRNEDCE